MNEELRNAVSVFNESVRSENWQAEVGFDEGSLVLENGLQLLSKNADLLLAICLNNGYYNKENIYRMLKFSLEFSHRVQVFFTDGPAKHNYRALGESESEIVKKCRLHRNRLRNHCINSLEKINAGRLDKNAYNITFLDWTNIYQDPTYQQSYNDLKNLYGQNQVFHHDIDNTTRRVLENRTADTKDLGTKISIAIEYVLEELAFILAYSRLSSTTKPVPDHGLKGFNYMYYEPWPVFENLVNGIYDSRTKEEIGFVLVKI